MDAISVVVGVLLPWIGIFTFIAGFLSWKNEIPGRRSFTIGSLGLFIFSLGYVYTGDRSLFPIWLIAFLGYLIYKSRCRWHPILKRWQKIKEGKTILVADIKEKNRKNDGEGSKIIDTEEMFIDIWSRKKEFDFWNSYVSWELNEIINELQEAQEKELKTKERKKIKAKLEDYPGKEKREKLNARLKEIEALEKGVMAAALILAKMTLKQWQDNKHRKHITSFYSIKNYFDNSDNEQKRIYIELMNKAMTRLVIENQKKRLTSSDLAAQPPLSTEAVIRELEKQMEFASHDGEWGYMSHILYVVNLFYKLQFEEEKFAHEYGESPTEDVQVKLMSMKKKELDRRKETFNNFTVSKLTGLERDVYNQLTQKAIKKHELTRILMEMEKEEWRDLMQQEQREQTEKERINAEEQKQKLYEDVETKILKEALDEAEEGKIDFDKIRAITQHAKMKEEKEWKIKQDEIKNKRKRDEALKRKKEDEEIEKILIELPKKIYASAKQGQNYVTLMEVGIGDFDVPKGFTEHLGRPGALRNHIHWLKGAPKRLYDRLVKIENVLPTLIDRSEYFEEREESFLVGFYIGVIW